MKKNYNQETNEIKPFFLNFQVNEEINAHAHTHALPF